MNETSGQVVLQPTLVEIMFVWFMRVVACYCLLFGVLYWIRLIGYYPGPLFRFDLMPMHWQVAATSLAVLFPFAAAGLWMLASWGPVIWFLCAASEAIMFTGLSQMFGHRWLIVAVHGVVAVLYIVFKVLIHWQKRQVPQ